MKLYVTEKLFSFHNRFYVKDINGNDVYEISSKAISFGDKTTIKNMLGEEIAYIEQQLFHFMPNYNIYMNNRLVCNISKKFQLFKNDYILDNGFRVEGEFLMLDFSIYDQTNNEIGHIKRNFISIGDKYEIEIKDSKDCYLILAIIVAIANDVNRKQRSNNN